jgi:hypothetical protein
MNKKIITALLAITLLSTTIPASKAQEKPYTLAIIDTALDTTLPEFRGKIVHEVCILDWNSCPNGKNFMEGPGAALMPLTQMSQNGFDHGTQMASAAISTNPNIQFVFIRFVGATNTGVRQITNESSFVNALNWVLLNKDKYNIRAVSMSQSHHNLGTAGTKYCPSTPLTENIIGSLTKANVPVFLPAGNLRDLKRISWPSCISQSIAVSASAYGEGSAVYTNYDPALTDLFARGDMRLTSPGGIKKNVSGTSVSTQVAASAYIALANKNVSYTSDQLISLLKTKTIPLLSRSIKKARIIDPNTVLNG